MNRKSILLFSLLFCGAFFSSRGQGFCPTNIDFELGTTANWTYYKGTVAMGPVYTLVATPPVPGWHTLTAGAAATDYYGGFPIVAPGGGTYSLKLGHDTTMDCAERARYFVHIPAGSATYSLVYHYAAVLENPASLHTPPEMPRLVVAAYDSLSGDQVPCISYTYVASGTLPGFTNSSVSSTVAGNGTDVWYKPWTLGNMKFPGYNGRTVTIEFTANACTQGGHFGYGYVDMTCGLFAISVSSCGSSTATVSAPPGYLGYAWFDSSTFSTSYGTTASASIPIPGAPTTYAVICTPYAGYGCADTLYTRLYPTALVTAPTHDTTICAGSSVTLSPNATDISLPLTYNWIPAAGLSCSSCGTTIATPLATTTYAVTTSDAGGCVHTDNIHVTVVPNPTPITGSTACIGVNTSLGDGVTGGVWASSNTAVATIGTSGVIGGVSSGTTVVTYSFGSGLCSTSTTVNVSPVPPNISGPTSVCVGSTITLTDGAGPGTWTTSSSSTATVGSTSGIVGGVVNGTVTITYTALTGCSKSMIVTVNSLPGAILGATSVCAGITTSLTDGAGTWSSNNTAVATAGTTTGIIKGIIPGTAVITYTAPTGCTTSVIMTVNISPPAITGTMNVCVGLTTLLADGVTGGTWTSSNTAFATVTSTGIVSGITASTPNITFTAPGSCFAIATVTVNPLPGAISPATPSVCVGAVTPLSDPGSGTWSSSNTLMATVVPGTGALTGVGVAGGTATITYTLPTGCQTTSVISVNPLPSAIFGPHTICEGGNVIVLNDTTLVGLGTWLSSNTSVANIDPFSGTVVSGVAGVTTITYDLLTDGCTTTMVLTVNPNPPPILGSSDVCSGATVLLIDGMTGGTWSSSSTALGTVGSLSGQVTGGFDTTVASSFVVTYTGPAGCATVLNMTLRPLPHSIAGVFHLCAGQSSLLTDASSPGVWSSGSNLIATVTPGPAGGGVLTGVNPGVDTITFTLTGTGCSRTTPVTVNSTPLGISGSTSICLGSTSALTDAGGGTWTSGTASVATAGFTTGVVGCSTAGTSTITYSLGGSCASTIVVTCHALPAAISGTLSVCAGAFTALSDPAGPGTWASGNTAIATVGPGTGTVNVYGAAPGTAVITYTPPTGCARTAILTVNPLPAPCPVGGGGSYCSGTPAPHIVDSCSTAGIVYKIYNGPTIEGTVLGTGSLIDWGAEPGAGTYTVTGTTSFGCTAAMTGSAIIAINPLPTAYNVTGGGPYCAGAAGVHIGLAASTSSGPACPISYQLFLGITPVGAPVIGTGGPLDFGLVTASGTYTVIATNTCTGCTRTMTGSASVTISPVPTISGPSAVCVAASITESVPGFSGGTWVSSNTTIASVGPTGIVTGGSTGPVTITYTSSSGCSASTVITVSLSPRIITGPNSVCLGSTAIETDTVSGGVWSVTNTSAIVGSSLVGAVTGVSIGTTTIVYSLGGSGCTVTKTLTITPAPAPIGGAPGLCYLTTTALSDINTGGTWTSSNTTVATVNISTGSVLGMGTGTATIIYTLGGCTASIVVTVDPAPGITTGPPSVCAGSSVLFSNAIGGGTWTSSNTFVATVDGSGNVWGLNPGGADTITYSLGGTCVAVKTVTVNPIFPVGGSAGLCVGTTTILTDATSGGTWSSNNTSVATVPATSGSPVIVSGASAGTAAITYTTASGCTASETITVNLAPSLIAGNLHVCQGLCTQLNDTAGGGTWTAFSSSVTVDGTGLVCGIAPGTATVTYSLGFGCTKSVVVTVNPLPHVIGGITHVCSGSSTTLGDLTTGGTWAVLHTLTATVGPTSGTVVGEVPGLDTVVYTAPTGCSVSAPLTVNPLPSSITGLTSICVGATTMLSDGSTGGIWSSSNTGVAVVNSTSGLVTGDNPGTTTITYTLGLTGCQAFIIVTVLPPPPPITGASMVCVGLSTTLHNATTGGLWSTGPSSLAVINPSTGVLTGVSSGTVLVSYTIGCSVIRSIIIDALSPITGSGNVCAGLDMTLTDTTAAGAWSSTNTSLATVIASGFSTGLVGGVAPGVDTIIYTLPTGCAASKTITVNPAPPPIAGVLSVCAGSTTTLTDVAGGTWSSSNTAIATMIGSVVHAGVTSGVVSISYLLPGTGCPAVAMVTVNPVPPAIGGPSAICFTSGAAITLTDALTGGVWSSASSAIDIDSLSGVLTGVAIGTATVAYTMPWGCSATAAISVVAPPAPIGGVPASVCAGSMITLTDATSGGSWSSGSIGVATVDPITGDVWGVPGGFGPVLISYTVAAGCPAIAIVTVNPLPDAILGTTTICQGSFTTLTDGTPGGTWMSSDTTVAHINITSGHVFANGSGATTIVFTAPSGCTINTLLFVNPAPAPISGSGSVCLGLTASLSDPGIGSWSSSNSLVASIDAGGTVYGLSSGTALISYSPGGCAATLEVTVAPAPLTITGNPSVCSGATIVLGDPVAGGTWSSSNTAVATVDMYSGAVTGVSTVLDLADITYTTGAGCSTDAIVTVNALPAAITGTPQVCAGASAPVFDGTGGGNWSSSNTAIAIIPPSSGAYTGVTPGSATIIYTLNTGCTAAYAVTVNPMPQPITGSPYVCLGANNTLSDVSPGGTWSVSPAGIVSLASPSSGVIGGTSVGSAGICYTLGFGCTVCTNVTVEPLPAVHNVTGGGSYCNGGAGVPIGLDGSGVGVNYLLYRGVTATGAFPGTGAPLSFGLQSVAGPYTVIAITTSTGCSNIMTGNALVSITPTVAPSVNIATGADTLCSGTSATFSAVPGYGGLSPAYIWTVNGVAVGAAPTYTFVPANGDVVGVTMASTGTCPFPATASHSLTMTVFPHEMPVANVTATPGSEVCKGSAVILHCAPAYGGPTPAFAWTKNGTAVGSGPVYAYLPSDGDWVNVKLTSDYLCRLADVVYSDTLTIRVDTPVTPVVNIVGKPGTDIAAGQFDTLTATAGTDGILTYQWVVNELPVSGATSNTFISNNFSNTSQDSITCVVKSEGICTASSFGWVYVHTHPVGVAQVQQQGSDVSIIPNPNTGTFTVKGSLGSSLDEDVSLEVTDMLGQVVFKNQVTAHNGKINEQVSLNSSLANGMYLLNLRPESGGSQVFHIVVER